MPGQRYDRIIATAAVPDIPPAWIEQLNPGGKILANLRGDLSGANLCLLTKESDDEAIGPILPLGGHFMWLRPDSDDPHRPHENQQPAAAPRLIRTVTTTDPASIPVDDDGFRFLLQAQVNGLISLRRGRHPDPAARAAADAVTIAAGDGSHAAAYVTPEAPGGHWRVVQSGPRRLWDTLTATYEPWQTLGEPAPDRFGVVANLSQACLTAGRSRRYWTACTRIGGNGSATAGRVVTSICGLAATPG